MIIIIFISDETKELSETVFIGLSVATPKQLHIFTSFPQWHATQTAAKTCISELFTFDRSNNYRLYG